jgi:hypothetical protein
MAGQIAADDTYIYGTWQRPPNATADEEEDTVHDDAMAQTLGFSGGLVSGSILNELFPPLLLKTFGERWFNQGSVSVYFPSPITDREEVRAVIGASPRGLTDVQVAAWIETPDGRKVAEGTVAVGAPDAPSALRARKLDRYAPGELRILAGVRAGDELPPVSAVLGREQVDKRKRGLRSILDCLDREWPWGADMATVGTMGGPLSEPIRPYRAGTLSEIVMVVGAVELRNVNGPVIIDRSYQAGGVVVYVGTSPKTEYVWFDTYLEEEDGSRVAEMRTLYRYMKATSPLYQEHEV